MSDAGQRLDQLLRTLEGAQDTVVLTHDNPDPDAIASASALAYLLQNTTRIRPSLAFGGIVGRAENRALIDELSEPFVRVESIDLTSTDLVALVDTQPRSGNNSLPKGRIASVVIDHHPLRPETAAASFIDVRPEYGASCSMLLEYLRAGGLEPTPELATALFYGIQSETQDLGRETSAADIESSVYLYSLTDPEAISRIRHARVHASYFGYLHNALEKARRSGDVIHVRAGRLVYPDMVAELADMLMRVERVEWAIASGRYQDDLLFSLRTYQPHAHAGDLVRDAVGERGSAGGHGMLAGARISIKGLSEDEVESVQDEIMGSLLGQLGVDAEPARPIIRASSAATDDVGDDSDADASGGEPDAGES